MKFTIQLLSILGLSLCASQVFAHAHITSPTARNDAANKEAAAPCGGSRGDAVTVTGGEILPIEWEETIDHPGHYILRFSLANDENFSVLVDDIPDRDGGGTYNYDLRVPMVACDDCTIQLIQVMTDRNPPTNYYSCLDIVIDIGGSNEDMGNPPDMGTTEDMGATNNGTGNNGTGNNGTGNNGEPDLGNPVDAGNTPGAGDAVTGEGEACSTSFVADSQLNIWALLLVGSLLLRRRRTK